MNVFLISYNNALGHLVQSQVIPYIKELTKMGVTYVLLTFERPYLHKGRKGYKTKIQFLKKELKSSGIKWYYLKYHKRPPVLSTLYDIFQGIIISFYIVLKYKINIIHARSAVSGCIAYLVAVLTKRRFLLDERGVMAEEFADAGIWKRGFPVYKITKFVESYLIKKADSLVVLTENIKNVLLYSGYIDGVNSEITVIPCCVDLNRFNGIYTLDRHIGDNVGDKFIFLYMGSLGTWYMIEEMLDFFIIAKKIINNAHFYVLTNSNTMVVNEVAIKKNLDFKEMVVTNVEFNQVPRYLAMATVGIFFIKPLFSKKSSCPIKFAEYLAAGVPVVVNSGIGDIDRIVEDNKIGVLVDRFDADCYEKALDSLLNLLKDKDTLRNRCINTAKKNFSLQLGVERYYKIYKRLICS